MTEDNKGGDGIWRRHGQEYKLCPVALCCFPDENVALTHDFTLSLFLHSYLKREAGIYSHTH